MAHEWDRGVLNASSWHGLETVGVMADAAAMIAAGESSGAWPIALRTEALFTGAGLTAPLKGIVGSYEQHPERVLGAVGNRFRATACDEWRDLVRAACAAGAKPTGAFSLRDGSRVLATFEVGVSNGLKTQLLIADAFDGSMKLTCGFTSIRVVCANTMSAAMRQDGKDMAALRHTASLEQKVNALAESIGRAVLSGDKVRAAYEQAKHTYLSAAQGKAIFDALFPEIPAAEGEETAGAKAKRTKAENAREEARRAAKLDINREGDRAGNLATLWNAATYLVDRNLDGSARDSRGDVLDSMLFGARADRIAEIENKITLILKDGTESIVTGQEAISQGIDPRDVGKAMLAEYLA